MFTNGYITKGLKGIVNNPVEERKYLYRLGRNMADASGSWSASGYSLYNGKTIQEGNNQRIANPRMYINSPGNGSNECVLLGTGIAVPTLIKRYLVIEARVSKATAADNYQIVLSKTKELNDDSSTVFYSFPFQETALKCFIDLSELSGFTRAYIAITGGAMAAWTDGSVLLQVNNIYLTDHREDAIVPLYNRGEDYGNWIEGEDIDKLIGWEGYTSPLMYVAATFETNDILFEGTTDEGSGAVTTRAIDISKMSAIKVLVETTELPAGGTSTLTVTIKDQSGTNLRSIQTDITSLGKETKSILYSSVKEYIRTKNKIAITVGAGTKAKVYAVWIEQ